MSLAEKLAAGGLAANEETHLNQVDIISQFPKADYFNLVVATALTWTGHAVDRKGYHLQAIEYLETGSSAALNKVQKFSGRLGKDHLAASLQGWREIILQAKIPDLTQCSAAKLKRFQDRCLLVAENLKKEETLHGVGPWLFCAPFKIIVAHQRSLWDDPKINDILMPLGLEVIRGMKLLIKNHSAFVDGVDTSMITEQEGSLFDGLGTVSIVQSVCIEIATHSNSLVTHINSGLILYAKNELE